MFLFSPLLLQAGLLTKVGKPALSKLDQATEVILAQENTTIKMLWGMLCLMGATMALTVGVGVLAWRMWGFVKGREKEIDETKRNAALDESNYKELKAHVEGLVKLLAQSQAIDQGHHEDHTKFVHEMLQSANQLVKDLYAETQTLNQHAREQDKESMNMVGAMRQALDLFAQRLNSQQESIVTSISLRESNHSEVCALLNLLVALHNGQQPRAGTAAGATMLGPLHQLPSDNPRAAGGPDKPGDFIQQN